MDAVVTIADVAAPATHFSVSAPASAVAGVPILFTVTALDSSNDVIAGYSGSVRISSSDALASLPAASTLANGVGYFAAVLRTAGTSTLTAADTVTAAISGTSSAVAVSAAPATHFIIAATGAATAGITQNFTVTARDAFGNIATTYSGTVRFATGDAKAVVPANATLTAGVGTFSTTFKTAGSEALTATDVASGGITGSSLVAVIPAPAAQFTVTAPVVAIAGSPFVMVVTARDAFGNTATGYAGTVHFSSTDNQAALPTAAVLTGGIGKFAATLATAGANTVIAADAANSSIVGTSNPITVSAAAASRLALAVTAAVTAGTPFSFTVTAVDAFGNTATSYGGTVRFGSSDGRAVLPSNATLASGIATFNATLFTSGAQTISVADASSLRYCRQCGGQRELPAPPAISPSASRPASRPAAPSFSW